MSNQHMDLNIAPATRLLPHGHLIRVWNTETSMYEDFPSETVYKTKGSQQFLDALAAQSVLYREHCKAHRAGNCPWGYRCSFVHVSSFVPAIYVPAVRVNAGTPGSYVDLPVDQVFDTHGVQLFLQNEQRTGSVALDICPAYMAGSCPHGSDCLFVHPAQRNDNAGYSGSFHSDHHGGKLPVNTKSALCPHVRLRENCNIPNCQAAHSLAELQPPPGALTLLPPGFVIHVFDDELQATLDIPSEQVYNTRGVQSYLRALVEDNQVVPLGREVCQTFKHYQRCEYWDRCSFIHIVAEFTPICLHPKPGTYAKGKGGRGPPAGADPQVEVRAPIAKQPLGPPGAGAPPGAGPRGKAGPPGAAGGATDVSLLVSLLGIPDDKGDGTAQIPQEIPGLWDGTGPVPSATAQGAKNILDQLYEQHAHAQAQQLGVAPPTAGGGGGGGYHGGGGGGYQHEGGRGGGGWRGDGPHRGGRRGGRGGRRGGRDGGYHGGGRGGWRGEGGGRHSNWQEA
eukprot:TRINITY_DN64118_c0_g1_i1.p1 TRINITY_DN64118_c0_g1~~TRINITY_DN64118_c0_g1_i1.p1  ORF type:complete len:508 (-),score=56.63 TRINITY_DN64118_c0_g1_i1:1514-3037(-)